MPLPRFPVRLAIIYVLVALGLVAVMASRLLSASRDAFLAERRLEAEGFARECREAVYPRVDSLSLKAASVAFEQLAGDRDVAYAEIFDLYGAALWLSASRAEVMRDVGYEGRDALKAGITVLRRYRGGDGIDYLAFSVPVRVGARQVAVARTAFYSASLDAALRKDKRSILAVAAVALLAAAGGPLLLGVRKARVLASFAAAASATSPEKP